MNSHFWHVEPEAWVRICRSFGIIPNEIFGLDWNELTLYCKNLINLDFKPDLPAVAVLIARRLPKVSERVKIYITDSYKLTKICSYL